MEDPNAKRLPEGFVYASNQNPWHLEEEELRLMLKENQEVTVSEAL